MRGDPRCDKLPPMALCCATRRLPPLCLQSAGHKALLGSSSGLTCGGPGLSGWQLWASSDQPGTSEPWWLPPVADTCQSKC